MCICKFVIASYLAEDDFKNIESYLSLKRISNAYNNTLRINNTLHLLAYAVCTCACARMCVCENKNMATYVHYR